MCEQLSMCCFLQKSAFFTSCILLVLPDASVSSVKMNTDYLFMEQKMIATYLNQF